MYNVCVELASYTHRQAGRRWVGGDGGMISVVCRLSGGVGVAFPCTNRVTPLTEAP